MSDQVYPQIVSDGVGSAFVTWEDYRGGMGISDIYAQHVLASGVVDSAWTASGTALCSATNDQARAQIVSDGVGGAIVTWEDYRSGTDIYAQRIYGLGEVADVAPGQAERFAVRAPYPNPTRGGATVGFDLPAAQRVSASAGGYFIRVIAGGGSVTRRVAVLR